MKKIFVTALVLAASASPVHAQALEFSGGVNFAELSGNAISSAARTTGMRFGLDVVLPVGPVGLNLGADWSQKGVEQTILDATTAIDLSYIEIPVHVRLPIVSTGPARINVVLGPTLGINTGCEISTDLAGAEACADATQGAFDPNRIDWAGTGGLGFSFGLGRIVYAGLDLMYTMGFSSVDQLSAGLKNRAFTLQSHIGFGIF